MDKNLLFAVRLIADSQFPPLAYTPFQKAIKYNRRVEPTLEHLAAV